MWGKERSERILENFNKLPTDEKYSFFSQGEKTRVGTSLITPLDWIIASIKKITHIRRYPAVNLSTPLPRIQCKYTQGTHS
jgi:hypothetical protein